MAYNAWTSPLGGPMVDDAAVDYTNSTTLTAVSPGGATNSLWYPGNTLKAGAIVELEAWGSLQATTTPTLVLGFYWGGTGGVIIAASTTSLTITSTGGVNWAWRMVYKGRVTQCGTSGQILGTGELQIPTSLTAFTARRIPEVAPAAVTIDTTINKAVVVGATWGTAASTTHLSCNGFLAGVWG